MSDGLASTTATDRSGKYLLGKDGWIFLDRDSNRVIDQIRGRHALDPAAIEAWRCLILERDAYAASIGARHFVLVAPNKELVHAEALPDGIEVSEHRAVNQIMRALRGDGHEILYPLDALREARPQGIVYPRTDTHWSGFGAWIGYRALCDRLSAADLRARILDSSAVRFEPVDYVGDLGVKLDPAVSAPTLAARIEAPEGRLAFDNRIPNRGRLRVFTNEDHTLPRCVMFGDSFGGNLLPYLKETFGVLVYVYGKVFDRELIEAYRPEVVLTQIVERFLVEPPEDRPSFSYVPVVRDKLKLLSADDRTALEAALGHVSPSVFPFGPVYQALLTAHAGRALDAGLVATLRRDHTGDAETNWIVSTELSRAGEHPEDARAHAELAVAAAPENARYRHQLALTLMRLAQPEQAEQELRRAIDLDGGVDWWRYQLAQVLFRQDRHDRCREALKDYLTRRPGSSDGWQLLGRCHEALEDVEAAADAFERAAEFKPGWAWPLLKLANLRLRTKTDPDQGLAAAGRLLGCDPDRRQRAEVLLIQAQLHGLKGDRQEAIDAARRSADMRPDWDWARTVLDRMVALPAAVPARSPA